MMRRPRLFILLSTILQTAGALTVAPAAEPSPPPVPTASAPAEAESRPPVRRLGDIILRVRLHGVAARQAFAWWSQTTGIALVADWENMRKDGVDPDQPVTVELHDVAAGDLLTLLLRQAAANQQSMIYETTPWFIEIMTKNMANHRSVTRVYDVRDLLFEAPNYDNAPDFDLAASLSAGSFGKGGGGGGKSLFTNPSATSGATSGKSSTQRGEELAKVIRDTIEPELWTENGGQYASIRYFQGRLIVKAPLYVHTQIGMSEVDGVRQYKLFDQTSAGKTAPAATRKPDPVAGVQTTPASPVSGTQK